MFVRVLAAARVYSCLFTWMCRVFGRCVWMSRALIMQFSERHHGNRHARENTSKPLILIRFSWLRFMEKKKKLRWFPLNQRDFFSKKNTQMTGGRSIANITILLRSSSQGSWLPSVTFTRLAARHIGLRLGVFFKDNVRFPTEILFHSVCIQRYHWEAYWCLARGRGGFE